MSAWRVALILVLLLLWACGYANRPEHWPARGPLVCVVNDTRETVNVSSRRYDGVALESARRLKPGRRAIFRWPWIFDRGVLVANNFTSLEFSPWDKSYWRWNISEFSSPWGSNRALCP